MLLNCFSLRPLRALLQKYGQIPADFGVGIETEADPDSNPDKTKQQNIFMRLGATLRMRDCVDLSLFLLDGRDWQTGSTPRIP
jgi:hypothetical protein